MIFKKLNFQLELKSELEFRIETWMDFTLWPGHQYVATIQQNLIQFGISLCHFLTTPVTSFFASSSFAFSFFNFPNLCTYSNIIFDLNLKLCILFIY